MRITTGPVCWCVLAALGSGLACGATDPVITPLLRAGRDPEILIERPNVARPMDDSGTRFVTGWRFVRGDSGARISPTGSSGLLEVVHLGRRPRTLELRVTQGFSESKVTAWAGGRPLGARSLAGRVLVDLPADLPTGRVPIRLEFSDPSTVVLRRATVRPCADGMAHVDQGRVVQSGWSVVEIVRPLFGNARLTGRFAPPIDPSPEQRFTIVVDDGGAVSDTVFEWPAGGWAGPSSTLDFAAGVESGTGFVRVRLVSQGPGSAGSWSDLAVGGEDAGFPDTTVPAPQPPRLVVLYVMDALRADALGHLGSNRGASPVLDRLAREGVSFSRHFSVAPNTPTSTTALFTGRCSFRGGALPEDGPVTLAESFAAAGYRTAAVSGNPYFSPSFGLARGFESVEVVRVGEDFRPHAPPTPNENAERVHRAALAWIDALAADDRAFLYLHTLHPHNPYTPPEPYRSSFAPKSMSSISGGTRTLVDIRDGVMEPTAGDRERLRALYAANLAYNDGQLGRLLEQLETRFPKGELLLVVTSDHGEELFDHDGVLHGFTLYDEMIRVPLIVWWPTRIEPGRVDSGSDTLDLHTTLWAMVAADRRPETDGRSLWSAILGRGGAPPAPEVRFGFSAGERPLYMARTSRRKLIFAPGRGLDWGMGRGRGRTFDAEYLFDLVTDPSEQVNVAGSTDLEATWLRARLRWWIEDHRRRDPPARTPLVDEDTRHQLEALGYTE